MRCLQLRAKRKPRVRTVCQVKQRPLHPDQVVPARSQCDYPSTLTRASGPQWQALKQRQHLNGRGAQ